MAEAAKSALGALRAEYKSIVGKNPSPKLDAEALGARIAELKANPPAPAGDADTAKPKPAAEAKPKSEKKPAAAAEPTPSAPGTAFVRHAEGIGCSYGGVELAPGKDGKVLVPLQAVEELKAHGFEVA